MLKSRLINFYKTTVFQAMKQEFKYTNNMSVPKLEKIVLSMGFNKNANVEERVNILSIIGNQQAVVTKARKSIAQFSVREGNENGAKVTLRGNMMYHFLDKLYVTFLGARTFLGLNANSINVVGNSSQMNIGIKDVKIFHGVKGGTSIKFEGFNITIVSNSRTKEELKFLLKCFNFPFIGDK